MVGQTKEMQNRVRWQVISLFEWFTVTRQVKGAPFPAKFVVVQLCYDWNGFVKIVVVRWSHKILLSSFRWNWCSHSLRSQINIQLRNHSAHSEQKLMQKSRFISILMLTARGTVNVFLFIFKAQINAIEMKPKQWKRSRGPRLISNAFSFSVPVPSLLSSLSLVFRSPHLFPSLFLSTKR